MTFRIARSLALAVLVPASLALSPAIAAAADGKAVFMDKKCNKCHAVSSAAIEKTSKLKGPDLTTTAIKGDAKGVKAYLRKEVALNDKKHTQAFTGTDEELDAVVGWLLQQNAAAKKK